MRIWLLCLLLSLLGRTNRGYVIYYEPIESNVRENYESRGCDSSDCQTADFILHNMNLSADPCVDFYEYACGGWIKNNPVPPSQSHINQFQVAEEKLHSHIKDILEKDDPNEPLPVKAASLFYKSCVNTDRIEVEARKQLVKLLSTYGSWPMTIYDWNSTKFNWIQMCVDSIRRFSVMSLMHVYVGRDRLDSNQSVILIDQPALVLPRSMLVEPQTYKTHLEAYKQWIAATAMTISKYQNQSVMINTIEKEAQDVVQFEIDLAKIDWLSVLRGLFSETTITVDYNERIIVKELDFFFNFAILLYNTPTRILANYMHWRLVRTFSQDATDEMRILASQFDQIFSGIMQIEPRWKDCLATVTSSLNFAVGYAYVREYFDEETKIMAREMVDNIIEEFSHQLQNAEWMDESTKWSALQKVKSMTLFIGYPDWYRNSSALYSFYNGTILIENKFELSHFYNINFDHYAIDDTEITQKKLSIGHSHFDNVEQVRTFLYKQALVKLRERTNRNEEVSFNKKARILYFLTYITVIWWMAGPAIVNAFNDGYTNSITDLLKNMRAFIAYARPTLLTGRTSQVGNAAPADIEGPRVVLCREQRTRGPSISADAVLPIVHLFGLSMNYGSIGAVIGHEILHSFDDTGRLTDKYGNLAQWWTEDVIVTYENKTRCFIDQYSKFIVPIIANVNQTTTFSVNGMYTQSENIADNSGLRQAFFAYKKHIQENGEEKSVHRIQQFSADQLFFISYAMAWCESNTKESLMQEILNDPHSPHKVRVMGTLSNSPEFSNTFKCSNDTPMNPKKKCIIW